MCENFIDSHVADNEISIDGYSIVKQNRNIHGGGVLLYDKDGINYSEITELASEQVESVWIKLMYKKKNLMIGVMLATTRQRILHIDNNNLDAHIGDYKLAQSDCIDYLGVQIDETME